MKNLIKSEDLHAAYKVILWLLLSNNIAGIVLNPEMFFASIMMLMGIPGVILIIHYMISVMRKEPVMVIGVHLCALLYNIAIYYLISAISREVLGGAVWPAINIALSSIASLIIIANLFLPQNNNEN